MGKSAKILPFSPSSKSAKPLNGRKKKRPKSVMVKSWATRRARAAAAAESHSILRSEEKVLADVTTGLIAETVADLQPFSSQSKGAAKPAPQETATGSEDYFAKHARDLLGSASHGEAVQKLQNLIGVARFEGEKAADDRATATAKQVAAIHMERIVAAFIAEVEHAMNHHRGLPPDLVWTINSYTVSRVIDALNEAGYTAKGRRVQPETGKH